MSGRSVEGAIRGESERQIRNRDRAARREASIASSRTNLGDADAVLSTIRQGLCPVCRAGPFNSPGNHVTRIHGISAPELRQMAGMLQHDSITSDEYRLRNVERGRERYADNAEALLAGHASWRAEGGTTALTDPGRRARADVLDRIRPEGEGAYAHLPHSVRSEKAKRANEASREKRARVTDEAIRLVVTTSLSMSEIADQLGIARDTIRRALNRRGISIDGRTRRWQ